jgi:hypothetical protein
MNLSIEDYKEWKKQGLSDERIMKEKLFYRNKRVFQKWKKENGIQSGAKRYSFLEMDIKEIREMTKTMSYRKIAKHYGLTYPSFYDWILRQRKNGEWV